MTSARKRDAVEDETIIDVECLREQFDGDKELLDEVVAIFAEDCPDRLQEASRAIAAKDSEALRRAAHSLKGAAGTLAAVEVKDLAGRIEELSKTNDFETSAQLISLLEKKVQRLFAALESIEGFN